MLFYDTLSQINRHKGEDVNISHVKNVNGKWPLVQSYGNLIEANDGTNMGGDLKPYVAINVNGEVVYISLTHVQFIETTTNLKIFYNVFAKNQFLNDKEKLIQLFNQDKSFCDKLFTLSNIEAIEDVKVNTPSQDNSIHSINDITKDVNNAVEENKTEAHESAFNDLPPQTENRSEPNFVDTQPMDINNTPKVENTYEMPHDDISVVPTVENDRFIVSSDPDFGVRQEETNVNINLYDVTVAPLHEATVTYDDNTFPTVHTQAYIAHNMTNVLTDNNHANDTDNNTDEIM